MPLQIGHFVLWHFWVCDTVDKLSQLSHLSDSFVLMLPNFSVASPDHIPVHAEVGLCIM